MAKTNFQSIDEYIAACPEQSHKYMEQIRAAVKKLAPKAKERISYQIAAFELNGKNIIHFAGWKKHVSLYPVPAGNEAFEQEVSKYVDGKGTVKFSLDEPIPMNLVKKIIKLHLAKNLEMTKGKSK
jgi:uncharacterized protein YdhG (YjbR/CyaY superfamily)